MLQLVPSKEKPQFEVFYSQNFSKVVQYINKKIGNLHDAEDLAEEVFIYCFSHYDSYDPEKSSINTWLYMIVNSRIKNYYRDNKSDIDLETVVGVLADDSVDLDACIYLEQATSFVMKAIEKLPPKQRDIIKMRYFEEKSNEEIAEILNITKGNARVQLSRALDALEVLCADFIEGEK